MQETSPDSAAGKAEWRQWLRGILAAIADQEEQSLWIRQHVGDYLDSFSNRCVAAFSALPGEPELLQLLNSHADHRWGLPRVVGEELVFHQVVTPDQLYIGAFGIAEPKIDLPIIPVEEIDTFLCPGLGFDRKGMRLGRGKGFYDRALSRAKPEAQRIGIAFREQLIEQLPTDPHDIPMNQIITSSASED